jgi:hypothetical protein
MPLALAKLFQLPDAKLQCNAFLSMGLNHNVSLLADDIKQLSLQQSFRLDTIN